MTFVTRAMTLVAAMAIVHAPRSGRAKFLLGRLETFARELGTPWARGYARMARGIHEMILTSFSAALEASDEANRIFREECTGMVWESWSTRLFSEWSLFYLGAWRELRRRHDEHLQEARERGNVYGMALTRVPFGTMASLSRGDVEAARENAREAIATWTADGFHLQHYWFLLAESFLDLHAGRGDLAWSRVRDRWPALQRSLVLRIPFVRMQTVHPRGGCALAAARLERRARERGALLNEATRAARTLDRPGLPMAHAMAGLLRAGVAAVGGHVTSAARLLEEAAADLERQQVAPYAAAARWHLRRLSGDAAPPFLASEEVVDPAAMVRILAPGFEGS